jgi:hypothetical protein
MGFTWFLAMVAGEELARRKGIATLKYSIAVNGSYLFMRGCAFIFGGYPSEMEIYTSLSAGKPVEIGFNFFIYIFVFAAMFTASVCMQNKNAWVQDQEHLLKSYVEEMNKPLLDEAQ